MTLHGRVAFVTGGGRGIGRATALALATAGCDVAVLARTRDEVAQVAAEIQRLGQRSLAITADLADSAAVAAVVEQVHAALGAPTILVNNAAVVEPLGQTLEVEPAQWGQAMAINLTSIFALIHATLPAMLTGGWGRIVSVSSSAGAGSGMIRASAYSVTKAGLEMLTRNLAKELEGTGVTVNAMRPGPVDTAMQEHIRSQPVERVGQAMHDRFIAAHEKGALLVPELPARLLVQIIPGDATGEIISIDDACGQALLHSSR